MQSDSRLARRFDVIMGKPCVDEDIKTQQLDERVSGSDSDTSEDFEEGQQRL